MEGEKDGRDVMEGRERSERRRERKRGNGRVWEGERGGKEGNEAEGERREEKKWREKKKERVKGKEGEGRRTDKNSCCYSVALQHLSSLPTMTIRPKIPRAEAVEGREGASCSPSKAAL